MAIQESGQRQYVGRALVDTSKGRVIVRRDTPVRGRGEVWLARGRGFRGFSSTDGTPADALRAVLGLEEGTRAWRAVRPASPIGSESR